MGMSSRRPAVVDTTARQLLSMRRPSKVDNSTVTKEYDSHHQMSLVETTIPSMTAPRLPSRRPIDHRWDRSRGIIFGNAQRNALHDLRWSQGDGIVFAGTPASKRGYANRKLGTQRSDNRQQDSQASSNGRLIDNPHAISARDIKGDNLVQQLAQEQTRHKDIVTKLKNDIENERSEHSKTRRKLDAESESVRQQQRRIGMIEAESIRKTSEITRLQEEQAHQNARVQAESERIADQTRSLHQREANLAVREKRATKKEGELGSTIEEAHRSASVAARDEVEQERVSAEKARQRASEEAIRHQEQYHADVRHMKEQYLKDTKAWQRYDDELDSLVQARYSEEIKAARNDADRRAEIRTNYEKYRRVWNVLFERALRILPEMVSIDSQLSKIAGGWEKAVSTYRGERIHPWFPHRYPLLNRRMLEFLQSSHAKAKKMAKGFRSTRPALHAIQQDLATSGHDSRSLTRFHRLKDNTDNYRIVALVDEFLNESLFHAKRSQMNQQLASIEGQLNNATTESSRKALKEQRDKVQAHRTIYNRVLDMFAALKEVEALQALQADTRANKQIFLATRKTRKLTADARRARNDFMRENPANVEDGKAILAERAKGRREFDEIHDMTIEESDRVEAFMRKRHQLEIHLGHSKEEEEDRGQDVVLSQRLTAAQAALEKSVDLVASARSATRSLVSASSSPRRSSSTPQADLRAGTVRGTSTNQDLQALQIRSKELQDKLGDPDAYASEEARQEDLKKLETVRRKIRPLALLVLQKKRDEMALSKAPDHAKLAVLDKNIADARAKLSKESELPQEQNKDNVKKAPKLRGRRKTRPVQRSRALLEAAKAIPKKSDGKSESAGISSSADRSEESKGGIEFKASKSLHAARVLWPTTSLPQNVQVVRTVHSVHTAGPSPTREYINVAYDNAMLMSQAAPNSSYASTLEAHEHGEEVPLPYNGNPSEQSSQDSASSLSSRSDESYQPSQASQSTQSEARQTDPLTEVKSTLPSEFTATASIADNMTHDHEHEHVGTNKDDSEFKYNMSDEDYKNAILASKNTNAGFWTHKLYKNSEGKPPAVFYCTNFEQTEARAKEFLNEPVIGFDLEWESGAQPGKATIKRNVSLIQISSEDKIGLFQVALFKGDSVEQLMTPSLRAILESRDVAKTGVNIQGDARRLRECLGVNMKGLFELSHLYRVVMFSTTDPGQVNRNLFKLASQVENVLGLPLKKDDVRTSAWSKRLSVEQTDYAASDAYAGFRLYHVLEAIRKKMDPMPPRPAFWEDHQPLQLGDGTQIVAKQYKAKPKRDVTDEAGKEVEEDDDECEEYFDALESLDMAALESSQSSSQSAGVPLAGLDVTYPTLPSLDQPQDFVSTEGRPAGDTEPPSSTIEARTSTTKMSKRTGPPPSTEVELADYWVSEWRAALPAEYNLKVSNSTLRAYHLWHKQNLSCARVASLLREPPLALQTVASYVMQALKEEELAFDTERVQEPLGILPKSVHARYQKILNKVNQH